MIQINLKIHRNGFKVLDVTYGNFPSFDAVAAAISEEADDLANASVGYFSRFNQKVVNDDYRFAWSCSWENEKEVLANNGFWIWDAGKCYDKTKDNSISWQIVVNTSTSLEDKQACLEME